MADLVDHVMDTITHHTLITPGEALVIGVSGGVDSLVLLHVLCRLRETLHLRLHAATLDHAIRGTAGAEDAVFVRRTAAEWDVPVTAGRADVPALARSLRLSLEEAARQVRYVFLARVAQQVGAGTVAVGHQRDDQAETVLMHLIRGSGLSGLRGMLPRTSLGEYHLPDPAVIKFDPPLPGCLPAAWPVLIRPLIETPRAEIEAYAAAQGLRPRHDATNDDLTYFRNRLRHDVIPLLETLNPNIGAVLAQTADVLREDAALITRAGALALARAARESGPEHVILDRAIWAELAPGEKRHVVRAIVRRLRPDLRDITFAHVEQAVAIADRGKTGTTATLPGGLVLRVDYQTLILLPADADRRWDEDVPLLGDSRTGSPFLPGQPIRRLFGGWTFEAGPLTGEYIPNDDPWEAALIVSADAWLKLRTRRPGDRFRPQGMGGRSQKLSDTLINLKVPAAWRDRVPLLTVDDAIAWFVAPTKDGVRSRIGEPFAWHEPARGEVAIWVCWRRSEAEES